MKNEFGTEIVACSYRLQLPSKADNVERFAVLWRDEPWIERESTRGPSLRITNMIAKAKRTREARSSATNDYLRGFASGVAAKRPNFSFGSIQPREVPRG